MMVDDTREFVRRLNRQRKQARAKLSVNAHKARHDLHPRTLSRRWTEDKRAKLAALVDDGKQGLKKNTPLIGIASAAILLFVARKPISRIINHVRNTAKDQER
jgi:hypothetical protein